MKEEGGEVAGGGKRKGEGEEARGVEEVQESRWGGVSLQDGREACGG